MPRKSAILKLPADVRAGLDRLIRAQVTLEEIVEAVESEFGVKLAQTSVWRYRKKAEAVAAKMREAKELARTIVGELGEDMNERTGRLLVEMLHTMIFRWLSTVSAEEDDEKVQQALSTKDFMQLARAIRDVAQAATLDQSRELKLREEIARDVARQTIEAANDVEAISREAGLPDAVIVQLRQKFLGVRVADAGNQKSGAGK